MSPRPAAPKGARTAVRSTEVTSDPARPLQRGLAPQCEARRLRSEPRPAAPKGAQGFVRSMEMIQ